MLPCAHIAFLDEVFKANSAILNSLLTIINERLFYTEDGKAVKSDLISLFGASNERPAAEDGLEALYDRFMVRYYVDYLAGNDFIRLLADDNCAEGGGKIGIAKIKIEDLNAVNAYLDNIRAGSDIINGIYLLKEKLTDDPKLSMLRPSDRRMKNSIKLLKASALLDRRKYVDKSDVERVYPYVLWDTAPGATSNVKAEMLRYLKEKIRFEAPSIDRLGTYKKMAEDLKKKLAETESKMKNAGVDKSSALKIFERFEEETETI
jgi:MoxR-like ATPase